MTLNVNALLSELRRRHVFRIGAAYAIVGWLMIQVAVAIFPTLEMPAWSTRLVVIGVLLGFPLALVLAWAFELTPAGVKLTHAVDLAERPDAPTARWGLARRFGTVAALALVGGAVAFGAYRWHYAAATEKATRTYASLAVLPFLDLSEGRDQGFFGDGVAEEILNRVAQYPELKVAARTSAFSFKDKGTSVQEIARALGVAAVLEGSVRRAGSRVRVTAQLVDAADGFHLWSQNYERDLKDVIAVQDEIARAIAEALRLRLTGAASRTARPDLPPEAYDAYLKGLDLVNQRGRDNLRQAIALFEQTLALAPDFAPAHAGVATAYSVLPVFDRDAAPAEAYERSRVAARRALALDPDSAEATAATARLLEVNDFDHTAGEIAFRRALALNPSYANAWQWYGSMLNASGRDADADAAYDRALALDPLAPGPHMSRATALLMRGDAAGARAEYAWVSAIHPGVWLTELVIGDRERLAQAFRDYARAVGSTGPEVEVIARHALDPQRRREVVLAFERFSVATGADAVGAAIFWLLLGESERALAALERAAQGRERMFSQLRADGLFAPLAEEPRFKALLALRR